MSSGDGSRFEGFTTVSGSSLSHLLQNHSSVSINNAINTNNTDTSALDVSIITTKDKDLNLNMSAAFNDYKSPDSSMSMVYPLPDSTVPSPGKSPKKNPSIIAPLTLPKRFSKVQSSTENKKVQDNLSDMSQPYQHSQAYLQPIQPMSQSQPYQQLFYNTQTGTIMTLPVSASPYTYTNFPQPNPFVMVPPKNNQPHQPQQPQQIVYIKTATGQIVPVLTPATAYPTAYKHPLQQFRQVGSPIPKNESLLSPNSISPKNKKQKVSPSSVNSATRAAERLQKEQINLQMQMHPNLHEEFAAPNISDIYEKSNNNEDDDNDLSTIPTVGTAHTSNCNSTVLPASSNSAEEIYDDDKQLNQHQLHVSQSSQPPQLSESSTESTTKPSSQRIIGSVNLGSFTYKYSQTLSGNLVKDKELFDRLTENAWNSCIAKQQ